MILCIAVPMRTSYVKAIISQNYLNLWCRSFHFHFVIYPYFLIDGMKKYCAAYLGYTQLNPTVTSTKKKKVIIPTVAAVIWPSPPS